MANDALLEKIKQQGDLVRKLKSDKAPKDQVQTAFFKERDGSRITQTVLMI